MAFKLRSSNAANVPLTWTEMDNNLSYLLTNMSGSQISLIGPSSVTGSLTISGSSSPLILVGTASLQHVAPQVNGVYSLGTSAFAWSSVYATTFKGTAFSGSLNGTSSWATNALTASYIQNAQTASYIVTAQTASNITPAVTNDTTDRVITSNGNGTLNAESTFTYDGTTANLTAKFQQGTSTSATGLASHAEGVSTLASGTGSHAEGNSTIASGTGSHAEGYSTLANGNYSHTDGYYTTASASGSYAGGAYANSSHAYEWSRSNTSLGQYGTITLSAQTSNATPTQLSIGGTGVDYFTIPTNTAYYVDLTLMAFNPNTNTRTWNGKANIYNNAGTVAIDGTGFIMNIVTGSLSGGTIAIAVAAVNTNDRLAISVTGSIGTDIRWFAKADYIKLG